MNETRVWALLRTGLTILGVVAVLGLTVLAYRPVPVTVDGALVIVTRGTTRAALERRGIPGGRHGALLSVHGKVLDPAGGGAPALAEEGTVTLADAPLEAGTRLVSVAGADVVEPTAQKAVETTPGVRVVGNGAASSLESTGTPGRAVVTYGAVSGEEISRYEVSVGTPAVLRREPAWQIGRASCRERVCQYV